MRAHRLTVGLVAGVIVVLVLGAAGALAISAHQRNATMSARTASTAEPGARPASADDPSPIAADPSIDASGPSNNLTVQMTSAVRAHPRAAAAQQLLQAYFDAINQHDYPGWTSIVTSTMARSQNRAEWLDAYASTVDSSIWMQSMRDHPMVVTVRFTSEQDPDLAPPDLPVRCINWTLAYQLVDEAGALVVGATVPGSVTKAECP
jgi:hypothetical protein